MLTSRALYLTNTEDPRETTIGVSSTTYSSGRHPREIFTVSRKTSGEKVKEEYFIKTESSKGNANALEEPNP